MPMFLPQLIFVLLLFMTVRVFAEKGPDGPAAIGAKPHSGMHLVHPRPDYPEKRLVEKLKARNVTPGRIKSELKLFHERFARESSAWVSPATQARAVQREAEIANPRYSNNPVPVQQVSIAVLGLAVEFGGTDTFSGSVQEGDLCVQQTITATGPTQGQIGHPGSTDNNTIWYDPNRTKDSAFYENLVFGHAGVGRVRNDLKDPDDGLPGIDLLFTAGSRDGYPLTTARLTTEPTGVPPERMMPGDPPRRRSWWRTPSGNSWKRIPNIMGIRAPKLSGSNSTQIMTASSTC